MIKYRKYGKTLEITKIEKQSSGIRRVSNTRKSGLPINPRRPDSISRTKRICLRKLLSAFEIFGTPLLITLTFSGSASDVLFSSKALTRFQRRLSISFPKSASLFVPELSPRGRIHFHGLLFGVSQDWGDVKKGKHTLSIGRERKERYFQKLWGCGFVDLLKTDGSTRLAHYLSKYIAKASYEPFLSPLRLIRSSKGFPSPVELNLMDEQWTYIESRIKIKEVWSAESWTPYTGRITKQFFDLL